MTVTVTVNTHSAVPVESRNRYLTMVSPTPKLDPDWWDYSTIGTMIPSLVAVGSNQIPDAILLMSVMFSITSDGQLTMIGPATKGAEKTYFFVSVQKISQCLPKQIAFAHQTYLTTTILDVHTNKMATKVLIIKNLYIWFAVTPCVYLLAR